MSDNGIKLTSVEHPKPSLWERFRWLFRGRGLDLNACAVETAEIEIREPGQKGVLDR